MYNFLLKILVFENLVADPSNNSRIINRPAIRHKTPTTYC